MLKKTIGLFALLTSGLLCAETDNIQELRNIIKKDIISIAQDEMLSREIDVLSMQQYYQENTQNFQNLRDLKKEIDTIKNVGHDSSVCMT